MKLRKIVFPPLALNRLTSRVIGYNDDATEEFSLMQPFDFYTFMAAASEEGGDPPGHGDVGLLTRTRAKTKKPAMYRVLLLNDDFTPMDFVVHVLERFFSKNKEEATEIMLQVHRRGVGVCGVYTYEVAETKVNLVMDYARKNEHPLQCTMEKE
jgi:ATP-dependent Clp protease adaptor protein ClpS